MRLSSGRDPLRREHLRRHVGAAGAADDPAGCRQHRNQHLRGCLGGEGASGCPRGGGAGSARAQRLAVSHAQAGVPLRRDAGTRDRDGHGARLREHGGGAGRAGVRWRLVCARPARGRGVPAPGVRGDAGIRDGSRWRTAAGRDRRAGFTRVRGLQGALPRGTRLRREERISWGAGRPLRRGRLGVDAVHRLRRARIRAGTRGHDAFAVYLPNEPRRLARARQESQGALRRDSHRPRIRGFSRFAGKGVCAPSRGRNGGESSGANPRYSTDGFVEQVRSDRADDRQQVGDGGRLRDPLRRHGRWFCGDQGHSQDAGIPLMPAPEQHGARYSGTRADPRAFRRAQGQPNRPRQSSPL